MFGEADNIEESADGNCYATLGVDKMIPVVMKRVRLVGDIGVNVEANQCRFTGVTEKAIDATEDSRSLFAKRD